MEIAEKFDYHLINDNDQIKSLTFQIC